MVRWLIRRKLVSVERELGVSVDYLRHILDVSLGAFFTFAKIIPLAKYRRVLPPAPYHVARIVAVRDADCGTCLQIVVNEAKKDGVPHDILRAVMNANPAILAEELADVYRFTEAVVKASGNEKILCPRVRRHYGDRGLVELALAVGACRVFPVTKRALGYATSCDRVQIQI